MMVTLHYVQTQRGHSARETSPHYWNLGTMQENWNNMHVSAWQLVAHLPDPPLSSMLMGWGHCQCGGQTKVSSSSDPQSRSHPWSVSPVSLMLAIRLRKITHQGLLLQMAGRSSGHGTRWPQMWLRGSKSTCHTPGLTLMCHPQMVDDCSLILPFLSAPQTVGHPIGTVEGIWMVDVGKAHDLWELQRRHWMEEFQPLW